MFEFDTRVEELLEKKLMSNFDMTLRDYNELDEETKDILINKMYILKNTLTKRGKKNDKVKIKRI